MWSPPWIRWLARMDTVVARMDTMVAPMDRVARPHGYGGRPHAPAQPAHAHGRTRATTAVYGRPRPYMGDHDRYGRPRSVWATTIGMGDHDRYGRPQSVWATTQGRPYDPVQPTGVHKRSYTGDHDRYGRPRSVWATTLGMGDHVGSPIPDPVTFRAFHGTM
jgi:hypothetical protein